jgi:transcriptional regulator NrdR family protein
MPDVIDKLSCPACGCGRSHVTHVRQTSVDVRVVSTWRRRQCLGCGSNYDTHAEERIIRLVRPPTSTITLTLEISATSSNAALRAVS